MLMTNTEQLAELISNSQVAFLNGKYQEAFSEAYIRKVDRLVHLIISGEEIITTVDHPFYVQGRGFL